jgi:glycosyltransferase involved in cell wall biosynthesis
VSITSEVDTVIRTHLGEKNNKFSIINNGVNLSQFTDCIPYVKTENNNTKITIIQVAGFRKEKDQATLIRAMQYLPDNIHLLLVGDGENRPRCEQLAKELNVSDKVSFLGVRTDVPQLLKSADIAVLSSIYEGMPLSSIEAMASGKPFIASDVPGLREIVKGAGLLFPVGNERVLVEKINDLLSDSLFYKKTSQDCLEKAKQYDIRIMVDNYIELYKSL